MSINKELLNQARYIVLAEKNYSISFLQRTLGISWNLAASVISVLKKERRNTKLVSKSNKKNHHLKLREKL